MTPSSNCHLGNVEGQTPQESQFILTAKCALDGRREGLSSRSELALCCWNENERQGAVGGCVGVNVVELRTNLPQPIQQWGSGVTLSRCSSLPNKYTQNKTPPEHGAKSNFQLSPRGAEMIENIAPRSPFPFVPGELFGCRAAAV